MANVIAYGTPGLLYRRQAEPGETPGIASFLPYMWDHTYQDPRDIGAVLPAVVTDNLPIDLEPRVTDPAWRMPTFLDDYYQRVHMKPSRIALGNLLSTQVRQVEIWNAYFEPQLLSNIEQSGTTGIDLTQPQAAPVTYAGLEAKIYTLNISTNGSPVIDASYVFNFPSTKPTLVVTGRRVVVWPFMPQTEHTETLEWLTDILPSFNNEQRVALRPAPRQAFTHSFQLDAYQFSRAKAIATQWAHRVYGVPVWAELTRVGPIAAGSSTIFLDTSNADYRAGDIILVWESDTEFTAAENLEVLADRINLKLPLEHSYANAYVAPMRFARTFEGIDFRRGAHDTTVAHATFQVSANADLGAGVGYPTYRGKDVLTDRTVLVGDLSERISRSIDEFDNGSGPITIDVKTNWVNSSKLIGFDTLTRADRWVARKWIHARRGKQRSFWLPSWNPDLVLVQNTAVNSLSLVVRPIGYPLYYGVKDIMVQLKNGTRVYNRVLGGVVDANGNEILGLESPLSVTVNMADVDLICFMSHVRFNTDRVEIKHGYAGRASTSIPVTETPE